MKNVSCGHDNKIYFFWFIYNLCRCVFFFIFTTICFRGNWCFKINLTNTFTYSKRSYRYKIAYYDMICRFDWQYYNVKSNWNSIKMIFESICQNSIIESDKSMRFWNWGFFYLLRHSYVIWSDCTFYQNFQNVKCRKEINDYARNNFNLRLLVNLNCWFCCCFGFEKIMFFFNALLKNLFFDLFCSKKNQVHEMNSFFVFFLKSVYC